MTHLIRTERLDLIALTIDTLRMTEEHDLPGLRRAWGAKVDPGWPATVPAAMRRRQLAVTPDHQPWLTRAIVARGQRVVVGNVGFHRPPDSGGLVEIGYEVLPRHRRNGYATEAARALTDWAWDTGRAQVCVASIAVGNEASLALAATLGFVLVGEQLDPEDGPELVFHRRLPLPRGR